MKKINTLAKNTSTKVLALALAGVSFFSVVIQNILYRPISQDDLVRDLTSLFDVPTARADIPPTDCYFDCGSDCNGCTGGPGSACNGSPGCGFGSDTCSDPSGQGACCSGCNCADCSACGDSADCGDCDCGDCDCGACY